MDKLRGEVDATVEKLKKNRSQYSDIWDKINKLGGIVGELNGKRIARDTRQETVDRLKENLKDLGKTEQELQAMLDKYDETVDNFNRDVEASTGRYHEIDRNLRNKRMASSAKEQDIGTLQAEKANYERQVNGREQLVKQTARRHSIRGFDLDITADQVKLFEERLRKMAKDQTVGFEKARRDNREEFQQAQSVLNRISEQKSALNSSKETARKTTSANDRRIATFQMSLNRIDVDEAGKVSLETEANDTESRLGESKSAFEAAAWDSLIVEADNSMRSRDEQREKLDSELLEGTKRAGDSARLDLLQKDYKDRQRSLQTMKGAHGEKITVVVGGEWRPATIDHDFQQCLDSSSSHLADAERQRDGTSRELEQLNSKLRSSGAELKTKRQALQRAEQTVRDVLDDDDPSTYPERLSELEKERDVVQADAASYAKMREYYEGALDIANKTKACRLCHRDFNPAHHSFDDFIKQMRHLISKSKQEDPEQEAREIEADYEAVRAAKGAFDTWTRLKNEEVPSLEAEQAKLNARHNELTSELERQDETVSARQESKRDIESLSKTVQNIARYHNEADSFERQIKELSIKHKNAGLGRGLEQIRDNLKAINEQSKAAKTSQAKLVGDRERARNTITDMELALRDTQSKLSTANYQLREKMSIQKQIDELKEANNEQRETLRSCDDQIQAFGPQLAQAQAKCDDISRRGAEKDRQLQEEVNVLNNSLNKIELANKDIEEYISRGSSKSLDIARTDLETIKEDILTIEKEQQEITKQVNRIQGQLRDVEETRRTIRDNRDYRRMVREVDQIDAVIDELEAHDAEAEKDALDRKLLSLQNEIQRLEADQQGKMGELKYMDVQLSSLIEKWETSYKDAAHLYKEAHIKVETTKAAVEDLGRYAGALDKAIMKYHTLKMEEINRIIDELWRRTYQGTDVDTILIRSDNENVKGNKTYNYRVCMMKSDTEMDMRGRCSAGQKVLASIIIRLALAECFGVNCGLIALDEPTTNLDRDNIRALAESLSEIIRVRRQQSNFQLIVITHDEEFLHMMNCADYADHYYRVSRTPKQKSMIRMQAISEVM